MHLVHGAAKFPSEGAFSIMYIELYPFTIRCFFKPDAYLAFVVFSKLTYSEKVLSYPMYGRSPVLLSFVHHVHTVGAEATRHSLHLNTTPGVTPQCQGPSTTSERLGL